MSQSKKTLSEFGKIVTDGLSIAKKTVTQATSVTTDVSIDATAGVITTFASTLAAGGTEVFSVLNNKVDANSVIIVNIVNYTGATGVPVVEIDGGAGSGTFDVVVRNIDGASALDGSVAVSFLIV